MEELAGALHPELLLLYPSVTLTLPGHRHRTEDANYKFQAI